MTKNRLSHSSVSKFQSCAKKYEYHYLNRLRSNTMSAALLFGSAVDNAIQALLKKEDALQVFTYNWTFADVNGNKEYLPNCPDIVYSDSDADYDLLTHEQKVKLVETYGPDWEKKLDQVLAKKKEFGFKHLDLDEKAFLNHYSWFSLFSKGLLMIEAVKEKILPRIREVLAIQAYVKLENNNGDSVIGYADLVCRFDDIKEPIIFDFKTSSIEYKKDSVLTSPQLTLYMHALSPDYENTRKAGFIVLYKRIQKNKKKKCAECGKNGTGQRHKTCDADVNGKRCNGDWIEELDPVCEIDVIMDDIPVQTENLVLENIDQINIAIKNGVFTRNLQSCVQAWGKCEYFDKCYKGSDTGLFVAKEYKK